VLTGGDGITIVCRVIKLWGLFIENFVTVRFFYRKLSSIKSFDMFLDQIMFEQDYIQRRKDSKKRIKRVKFSFIMFYKKWFILSDLCLRMTDTVFVYISYYTYNKQNPKSHYKNNKINLKLTQTERGFIYNLNAERYGRNYALFMYGLKYV
jgi:hypothetical protein